VPTRLVTGYLAADFNEFGGFYEVRQGSAHAWLEAWVPERGWVTVDPTPSGSIFPSRLSSIGRRAERWLDACRVRWYQDVVGYDTEGRRETLNRALLAMQLAGEGAVRLLGAAAVVGGLWLLRPLWGAGRTRVRSEHFYRRMLGALERKGLVRHSWQTGREFSSQVAAKRPEWADAVRDLTALHYRSSYARRELTAEERRRIEGLLRELRSQGR